MTGVTILHNWLCDGGFAAWNKFEKGKKRIRQLCGRDGWNQEISCSKYMPEKNVSLQIA